MATKVILFLLLSSLLVSTRVSSIKEKFETPELVQASAPECVDLPPKKAPASPPKPPVYPPPKPPVKPPVYPPVKPPAPTQKPPTPAPKSPPVYPPPKPPVKPPVYPPVKPPTPAPKPPPVYPPPQMSPPVPPVFYGCSHKCVYYCKSKNPRPPLRACQRACSLCCKWYKCIPGMTSECSSWNYVKGKLGYEIKCP